MFLHRSQNGLLAKSRFYDDLVPIKIFIEDTKPGMKTVFSNLFKNSTGESISCDCIFPLGGREMVKSAYDRYIANPSGAPCVYVIDGDFNIYNNIPQRYGRFFQLSKYSIENYLFDRDAIIRICKTHSIDIDIKQIESRIDFEYWRKNLAVLISLYIDYAISESMQTGLPTTNEGISHLISCASGIVDVKKATANIRSFRSQLIAIIGQQEYDLKKQQMTSRIHIHGRDIYKNIVSGKSALFPLAVKKIKNSSCCSSRETQIMTALSELCSHDDFRLAFEAASA